MRTVQRSMSHIAMLFDGLQSVSRMLLTLYSRVDRLNRLKHCSIPHFRIDLGQTTPNALLASE